MIPAGRTIVEWKACFPVVFKVLKIILFWCNTVYEYYLLRGYMFLCLGIYPLYFLLFFCVYKKYVGYLFRNFKY
jgi:hypothetical protein